MVIVLFFKQDFCLTHIQISVTSFSELHTVVVVLLAGFQCCAYELHLNWHIIGHD